MKKISDLCTFSGFALILFSAGLSDMAGDMKSVLRLLLAGLLVIAAGKTVEFIQEYTMQNKKIRRSREWRRAKIKEQSYYTF